MIDSRPGGEHLDEEILAAIQSLPEPTRSNLLRWIAEVRRSNDESVMSAPVAAAEVERERTRMARELHDTIGGDLAASLALFKYYFENPIDGESREEVLRNIFEVLQSTLGNLRSMLRSLRSREVGPAGLVGELQDMAKAYQRFHGLDVLLKIRGSEELLPPSHQEVVFQVVREALSNVRRHSQSATSLINCNFEDQPFVVEIKDWGTGITGPNKDGFGLIGMRERAAGIGGRVQVVTSPARGTSIFLVGPQPALGS